MLFNGNYSLKRLHLFLKGFGIFLLFQDLIAYNFRNKTPIVGKGIKYTDEIVILLCLVLLAIKKLSRREKLITTGSIELPLLLFIVVGLLSSIINKVPSFIALTQLYLILKGFALFYIIINLGITKEGANSYVRFFGVVALIIFALGIVDFISPSWFRTLLGNRTYIQLRGGLPSVQSIFIHPGQFGWFMAFAALYAFAFYLIYGRFHFLMIGGLFSLGYILSFRRKPIGGIAIALLTLLLLNVKRGFINRKRFASVILLTVILYIPFSPILSSLYQSSIEEYSLSKRSARIALYLTSVIIANDYFPLGAGLGRYGSWMSRVHYSPLYHKYGLSHIWGLSPKKRSFINDTFWPMILGETGWIGLALYLWIMGILFYIIYKLNKEATSKFTKAFSLGALMVFVESLVESLGCSFYAAPPQVYFLFGSLGLAFAISQSKIQEQKA